jgi:hypothetical protein
MLQQYSLCASPRILHGRRITLSRTQSGLPGRSRDSRFVVVIKEPVVRSTGSSPDEQDVAYPAILGCDGRSGGGRRGRTDNSS